MLGSRRLLIVAVSALFVFSVVSLGTNSPDWAPLEHTNFQVASTINPYPSYVDSADASNLLPANPEYQLYYDYDVTLGYGGLYKPVRAVILSITEGNQSFSSYPSTIFLLLNSRLQSKEVLNGALSSDLVYSSDNHFAIYSPGV